MAAVSAPCLQNDLQEREPYGIHRSSSDRSDIVRNEKSAIPVETREAAIFDDTPSDSVKEVFDVTAIDPVLSRKMALVNAAIDEMGMSSYQWKLLWLNGFGYAVDSVRDTIFSRPMINTRRLNYDYSSWSFASRFQIQLFNRNTAFQVLIFLASLSLPKSAS
jgi:hypothetical protein